MISAETFLSPSLYVVGAAGAVVIIIVVAVWKLCIRPHLERRRPFHDLLPTPTPTCHWLYGHLLLLREDLWTGNGRDPVLIRPDANGRMGLWVLHWPVLAVVHWQDVRRILHSEFHRGANFVILKHLSMALGPNNLLQLNGRLWKHERSVILRSLTPQWIRSAETIITQKSRALARSLRDRIQGDVCHGCYRIDALALMEKVTLDVFGQVAFSHDFGCCDDLADNEPVVAAAFSYLSESLNRRMTSSPLAPSQFL